MKRLLSILCVLALSGCAFIGQFIPALAPKAVDTRPFHYAAADAGNPNAKPIYVDNVQPIRGPVHFAATPPITPPLPSDIGAAVTWSGPLYSPTQAASVSDVNQYETADCGLHAILESIRRQNYAYYSQIVTQSGGKNVVTFRRNLSAPQTVAVGNTFSSGLSARPNPATGAVIDPTVELAECQFHSGANTFVSLTDVYMGNIAQDLGISYRTITPSVSGSQALIKSTIAASNIATATTNAVVTSPLLVGAHDYCIVSVDSAGNVALRNPWGVDGQTGVGGVNPPGSIVTVAWPVFSANCPLALLGTAYPTVQPTPPIPAPTAAPNINWLSNVAPGSPPSPPISPGSPVTIYWQVQNSPATVTILAGGVTVYSGPNASGSVPIGSPTATVQVQATAANAIGAGKNSFMVVVK